ncbi:uncharacterized protein LOC100678792 isoform X2 [Nasonia vitripennis]|uniref:dCMP deaminase n=1 Tax=Nasonia vitripennis TaxID=7425 RepID=A0A7M7ILY5_NASVI|nr:uncharacterized protein LOC100678792 isoform X2 [Nasonia vitripennis]
MRAFVLKAIPKKKKKMNTGDESLSKSEEPKRIGDGYIIDLDSIFMEMADLVSKYSNDSKCKVGACIVREDNEIVSFGYNHMPRFFDDKTKKIMDSDEESKHWEQKEVKLKYVCHAELNAIVNKNHKSMKNGKIYQTLAPCDDCFKIIVKSGIKEINYNYNLPKWHVKEYMKKIITINQAAIGKICEKTLKISEQDKWNQYFMQVAYLFSYRCHNMKDRNGACIVNSDNKIVGVGYSDCTEDKDLKVEYCAELNAYKNSQLGCIENGKIYVTSYPCHECAKIIVQCGIQKLFHLGRKSSDEDTQQMFNEANVSINPMSEETEKSN